MALVRAPYAEPRASEHDMKQRVRLSGLFPRVRNQPMSTQLQTLMKEFENNAALTGVLERRRRLEERIQYEMRSREAVAALNTNLAPPFRTGNASFATSAAVAQTVANKQTAAQPQAPVDAFAVARARATARFAAARAAPDAAAVMTGGGPGVSGEGGSSGSGGAASGGAPRRGGRSASMPANRERSQTPSNKNRRKPCLRDSGRSTALHNKRKKRRLP